MIRRGLLCAALLLASPALPFAPQHANNRRAGDPAEQAAAQSEDTPAQPDAGAAQSESSAEAPLPPLRMDCTPAPRAFTIVGKHGCIAGKVYRIVFTRQGNIRLYLCPQDQCSFHATVHKDDADKVGSLLYLHGTVVAIEGDVNLYHGVAEIVIQDKDQVKVAAGGAKHESEPPDPGTLRKRRRKMPTERAW